MVRARRRRRRFEDWPTKAKVIVFPFMWLGMIVGFLLVVFQFQVVADAYTGQRTTLGKVVVIADGVLLLYWLGSWLALKRGDD